MDEDREEGPRNGVVRDAQSNVHQKGDRVEGAGLNKHSDDDIVQSASHS